MFSTHVRRRAYVLERASFSRAEYDALVLGLGLDAAASAALHRGVALILKNRTMGGPFTLSGVRSLAAAQSYYGEGGAPKGDWSSKKACADHFGTWSTNIEYRRARQAALEAACAADDEGRDADKEEEATPVDGGRGADEKEEVPPVEEKEAPPIEVAFGNAGFDAAEYDALVLELRLDGTASSALRGAFARYLGRGRVGPKLKLRGVRALAAAQSYYGDDGVAKGDWSSKKACADHFGTSESYMDARRKRHAEVEAADREAAVGQPAASDPPGGDGGGGRATAPPKSTTPVTSTKSAELTRPVAARAKRALGGPVEAEAPTSASATEQARVDAASQLLSLASGGSALAPCTARLGRVRARPGLD